MIIDFSDLKIKISFKIMHFNDKRTKHRLWNLTYVIFEKLKSIEKFQNDKRTKLFLLFFNSNKLK